MKTVVSALHFEWRSVWDCINRARKEFVVDGVELSLHESGRPHCTSEDIVTARNAKESLEATLYGHIWENMARLETRDAAEALEHWLKVSVEMGISGLVIHGGSFPDRLEGVARTRRVLEKVLPRFERENLVLYLENHYAYDYRNCQELFSEAWEFEKILSLDSPSLKFCLDTGHGNMTKNTNDLLLQLQSYLDYIHIADNYGVDDDHCPYGQGSIQWDSIWLILEEINFDGTFCMEFPVRDNLRPFRKCMDDITRFKAGYWRR